LDRCWILGNEEKLLDELVYFLACPNY